MPLVAPLLGAAVGTYLYQLCVTFHHPEEDSAILAEQGSIVLVNTTAIDPDIKMLPKEKDTEETVPAAYPPPPCASSTVSPTVPVTPLKVS